MRTRCPTCGSTLSLDALVVHEGAREALSAAFAISGQLGSALVRYIALFRPGTRDLTLDRVARLVGELLPDIQARRITRNRQSYDAPVEAWIWAIEQTLAARDSGRLDLPLTTHGWLYSVITSWRPGDASATEASPRPVQQSKAAGVLARLDAWPAGEYPEWWVRAVCGGLRSLVLLSLDGQPAADLWDQIIPQWLGEFWPKRPWAQGSRFHGEQRIALAFRDAGQSARRWPTPGEVLSLIPRA